MRIFGVWFALFGSFLVASAQDTVWATQALQVLCSQDFAGRGYVDHGQEKAANWLLNEFKQSKIAKATTQNFKFPVISFPGSQVLKADEEVLSLGYTWLPQADCPPISGYFTPILIDSSFMNRNTTVSEKIKEFQKQKNPVFLVDEQVTKLFIPIAVQYQWPVIILTKNPLLWTVEQNYTPIPVAKWVVDDHWNMPKKIYWKTESVLKKHTFQNVMAYLPGTSDSMMVITAHFDHLGKCGDIVFPGANDNASGTIMMVDLFHYFSSIKNRKYSLLFVGFSGEEAGLLGSSYYVQHPVYPLQKIKLLINLDLLATGEDGITVVNAVKEKSWYQQLCESNQSIGLKRIASRENAPNSDHFPFTQKQVPAIFIYAMGPSVKAYHHPNDNPTYVRWLGYHQIFHLLQKTISQ